MREKEKGITLVALVVTIIILLILAGIAIRAVTGENGLFQKAKLAKEEADVSDIIDSAKMDIMQKQIENKGGSITEEELKKILEKYGELSDREESTILDKKLTTTNGKYDIDVRRIYNGSFREKETSEMLTCTIKWVRDEPYTVPFESGSRWDDQFLYYSFTDEISGGHVLVVEALNLGYGFLAKAEGHDIWADYTSSYETAELHALNREGEDLGVVKWGDPVSPGVVYRYYCPGWDEWV